MLYLAKSNRADPEVVQRVREVLQRAFPSETILSYNPASGPYSNEDLLKCDILVVVPENASSQGCNESPFSFYQHYNRDREGYGINLGKGLYNQITEFSKTTRQIYIVGTCLKLPHHVEKIAPLFTYVSSGEVKGMKVVNKKGLYKVWLSKYRQQEYVIF